MSDEKTTPGAGEGFCSECGAIIRAKEEICPRCGVRQFAPPPPLLARVSPPPDAQSAPNAWAPNKTKAGLLAIVLGAFGAHKFYMRRPRWGAVYLLSCWTIVPLIVGIIEGIVYLCMNQATFDRRYPEASREPLAGLALSMGVFLFLFDLMALIGANGLVPHSKPTQLSETQTHTGRKTLADSGAGPAPGTIKAHYTPQDFYGRWGAELDGYSLKSACKLFSTEYLPGADNLQRARCTK